MIGRIRDALYARERDRILGMMRVGATIETWSGWGGKAEVFFRGGDARRPRWWAFERMCAEGLLRCVRAGEHFCQYRLTPKGLNGEPGPGRRNDERSGDL